MKLWLLTPTQNQVLRLAILKTILRREEEEGGGRREEGEGRREKGGGREGGGRSVVSRGLWRLIDHPLHSSLDHTQAFLHVCFVFPQYWEQRAFVTLVFFACCL